MSRAFVNEDAAGPERIYTLPDRDDPGFDEAAAMTLIEGWNQGDTHGAERATGYSWGEPTLRPYVEKLLADAEARGNDRIAQLARRFLR
ncbi:MAG TPA: hypothetical protein VGA37_13890 [Gemmatimonadales bacterium]